MTRGVYVQIPLLSVITSPYQNTQELLNDDQLFTLKLPLKIIDIFTFILILKRAHSQHRVLLHHELFPFCLLFYRVAINRISIAHI